MQVRLTFADGHDELVPVHGTATLKIEWQEPVEGGGEGFTQHQRAFALDGVTALELAQGFDPEPTDVVEESEPVAETPDEVSAKAEQPEQPEQKRSHWPWAKAKS